MRKIKYPVATVCTPLVVKYHNTDVVEYNPLKGVLTLRCGGWYTATTKSRINQFCEKFGVVVFQKAHQWYVDNNGVTTTFEDGISIKV